MPADLPLADPVLTCAEAGAWEEAWFAHDESREWAAMNAAARAFAAAVRVDAAEIGLPEDAGWRVLVLAGKGHNAGDALLAAALLPGARIDVALVFGMAALRPLAARAWRQLAQAAGERVSVISLRKTTSPARYDLVLDGVFGFSGRPPLPPPARAWLTWVNAGEIGLRAAVDLPSGGDEAGAFRADFTYATGSVKAPLLALGNAGRWRYLDLDFFERGAVPTASDRVLGVGELAGLRRPRAAHTEKRQHGHVLLVGGSRIYPGAILLAAHAALRSGVGLVTAAVPESLAAAFAASVPEVMWVGCPETPEGGLALAATGLVRARSARATAWMVGPGLGRETETSALVAELLARAEVPVVLDAEALQADLVGAGNVARVLTPHVGEFARIAGEAVLRDYARAARVVVLKGPVTRVCAGGGGPVYHSPWGGPVLARGGSGDVLAGLIGGLLAQAPAEPLRAATRGVVWHGLAADRVARAQGQVAVRTLDLVAALGPALRGA